MKWPKEYLVAFRDWHHNGRDLWNDDEVAEFFDDLHKAGALKTPKEPREFFFAVKEQGKWEGGDSRIVDICLVRGTYEEAANLCNPANGYEIIHVREVTEEE